MNYWRWFLLNVRRAPLFLALHPSYLPLLVKRIQFLFTRRYCGRSLTRLGVWNEMTMINAWAIHVLRELDGPWVLPVRRAMAPVILDIGSNVGQFSAYLKQINPGCRIFSFDAWYEAKYYATFSEEHCSCGLGRFTSARYLYVNQTTASTVQHTADYKPTRTILVEPLDDFIRPEQITLMKIDVDGAELDVLQGATETLKRTRFVLIETQDIESVKRLAPGRSWTTNNCGCDWTGTLKTDSTMKEIIKAIKNESMTIGFFLALLSLGLLVVYYVFTFFRDV